MSITGRSTEPPLRWRLVVQQVGRLLAQAAALALHPFSYLLLYLVILYIRPQEFMPTFVDTPIVPVSLLTAMLLWQFGQRKSFDSSAHLLMFGLLAVIFLSVLMTGWLSGAIRTVVDFLPTLMLFLVVATSITSLRRFQVMCLLLIGLCVVIAWHGIDQFESELGIGWTGAKMIEGRITYIGFLSDPNDLSMAFLMVLPLATYLIGAWRWWPLQGALLAAASCILFAVFLCNSRGAMLSLASMVLVHCGMRYGWGRSLVIGPLLVLPLMIFGPSRVAEISADEASAAGRIEAWYEGFDMFRSRPLLGVGKGLFTDHHPLTAHNSYVLAIAELGVIGYTVWLALLVVSVLQILRVLQHVPAVPTSSVAVLSDVQRAALSISDPYASAVVPWSEVRAAAQALLYGVVGGLVAAFFLSRTYVVFLFLHLAMMTAIYQLARAADPAMAPVRAGSMPGKLVGASIGSIVFLWFATRVLLNFSD
ncbi:MAG: O-antigen ligase family protein [Aquabacterium sp.]